MSYSGVYDKTIYYNPVSKYCVISVKTNDQSIPQKARSAFQHRDRLILFKSWKSNLSACWRYEVLRPQSLKKLRLPMTKADAFAVL